MVLNGHSTAGARKLAQSELAQLVDMGFPLPLEPSWCAKPQAAVETMTSSEESGSSRGTTESITTPTQQHQTHQNPVSSPLPEPPSETRSETCELGQTSGHCGFWQEVCEAQAGSSVVQDYQTCEFRDGLGNRSVHDDSASCVVHSTYQKDCLHCQAAEDIGRRTTSFQLLR